MASSTDASFRRVPRSLSSVLKMSMLLLASTATFQKSTAVCLGAVTETGDNTNARKLLLRGSPSSFDDRQLFDPRAPFDFYDDACQAECQGNEDLTLFDNVCPKCPEKYESQHCNHCCYDGASSLRLRWHGCPGEVTFASADQGVQDCGLDPDDRAPTDGIRFVSCSCYETINTPATFDASACQPLATQVVLASSYGIDSDICIVSVQELDGGAAIIDLSKPLPDVIGLVHSPLTQDEEDYTSQYWNPYPLRTYFDTTCNIIDEESAPYVLPLFPGYGKIPSSCPSVGFIDLEEPETLPLPDDIDHFDGELSTEPFWYEFVDGTSTGFWPGEETDVSGTFHFNPTFAVCSCTDCGGKSPTGAPVEPTNSPVEPTGSPVEPTVSPANPTPSPQSPPTLSPVSPTDAPVEPTDSPVEPTDSPVEPTDSPLNPTPVPQSPTALSPVEPTDSPVEPTGSPVNLTPAPQNTPTLAPVVVVEPTAAPQSPPTLSPVEPTESPPEPSAAPQGPPTSAPTVDPTIAPTVDPNLGLGGPPTAEPSPAAVEPTDSQVEPTDAPESPPTLAPATPSPVATEAPQGSPEPSPVATPSPVETQPPVSETTTAAPSEHDCPPPSPSPSAPSPEDSPTNPPTASPTASPTSSPTPSPEDSPTNPPTASPTVAPTSSPTSSPEESPTNPPTASPTAAPTPSEECQPLDYISCAVFSSTKCLSNESTDETWIPCVYTPADGRRALRARDVVMSASSSALSDIGSISKDWLLGEKQRHSIALASLRS